MVDFLKSLRLHVEAQLQSLAPSPLEYVIGVPVGCSEAARSKTQACAIREGIPSSRVQLITEPHAAALHAFETLNPKINIGDSFLLCDARDGTVDVTPFRFCGHNPHVMLQEITSGRSSNYESVNVSNNFLEFLENRLSNAAGWKEEVRDTAMWWFEHRTKRELSGIGMKGVKVPVTGIADDMFLRIENGKLQISDYEIRSLFRPIVNDQIYETMSKGTGRKAPAVILVGGFGESPFLFNSLQSGVLPKH